MSVVPSDLDGKVPRRDTVLFCRQLVALLKSGTPLLRALIVLQDQPECEILGAIVSELVHMVETGNSLSRSLKRFPQVFSPIFVTMVEIGENSGQLDRSLERLAGWLEADLGTYQRVRSALSYPIFIALLTFVLTLILFTGVMPAFFGLFADMGSELPLITRVVLMITAAARNPMSWLTAGLLAWGGSKLIRARWAQPQGAAQIYSLLLQLPAVGGLLYHGSCSRYAASMGTMLQEGLPMPRAYELASLASGNPLLAQDARDLVAALNEGVSPARYMRLKPEIYSKLTAQMLQVGEESARLPSMFESAATFHRAEMETRVEMLGAALEPLMMGCVSVVVGTIIFATFLPLYGFLAKLT